MDCLPETIDNINNIVRVWDLNCNVEQLRNIPVSTLDISDVATYMKQTKKWKDKAIVILLLEFYKKKFTLRSLEPKKKLLDIKKRFNKNKPDHYIKLFCVIEGDLVGNKNASFDDRTGPSGGEVFYDLVYDQSRRRFFFPSSGNGASSQNSSCSDDLFNLIKGTIFESRLTSFTPECIASTFFVSDPDYAFHICRDFAFQKRILLWVNKHTSERGVRIGNLNSDLRNGVALLTLVESLTQWKIKKYQKFPRQPREELENLDIFLKVLDTLDIKVDVKMEDIYYGRLEVICGIIFLLAHRFCAWSNDEVGKKIVIKPSKIKERDFFNIPPPAIVQGSAQGIAAVRPMSMGKTSTLQSSVFTDVNGVSMQSVDQSNHRMSMPPLVSAQITHIPPPPPPSISMAPPTNMPPPVSVQMTSVPPPSVSVQMTVPPPPPPPISMAPPTNPPPRLVSTKMPSTPFVPIETRNRSSVPPPSITSTPAAVVAPVPVANNVSPVTQLNKSEMEAKLANMSVNDVKGNSIDTKIDTAVGIVTNATVPSLATTTSENIDKVLSKNEGDSDSSYQEDLSLSDLDIDILGF